MIDNIKVEVNTASKATVKPSESKANAMTTGAEKKVFIKTFGCQMNEYDSNRMLDSLNDSHGVVATKDETDADIILLNTCSVREKAQEKVFSQLGRWKNLKDKNPELVIGVGGCVASQEGDAIMKRAPYVDMVFGPQTLHRLPKMYDDVKKTQSSSKSLRQSCRM